jgi:hypothetical protein
MSLSSRLAAHRKLAEAIVYGQAPGKPEGMPEWVWLAQQKKLPVSDRTGAIKR